METDLLVTFISNNSKLGVSISVLTCSRWWEVCRKSTVRQWPALCWECSEMILKQEQSSSLLSRSNSCNILLIQVPIVTCNLQHALWFYKVRFCQLNKIIVSFLSLKRWINKHWCLCFGQLLIRYSKVLENILF